MKAVILAGGIGSRLWPLSRLSRPKQFARVVSEDALIRDTYRRLLRVFAHEDIYFSVSPSFEPLLREEFPELEDYQIIVEPEKRDTGPAMGYVAAILESTDPDESIVFVPSDHYIKDEELFLRCLQAGDELIQQTGKLVDIGITPAFPSTVLGYTKIGEKAHDIDGIEVYEFAGHTEKPNYDLAKFYAEDGSYLWHANYYMWTPKKFMEAFERYHPEMGATLRQIQKEPTRAAELFSSMERTSIDYAITEKMDDGEMLVIRGDFGWSDIGAWDTLYDRLREGEGNVTKGRCVTIDTNRSLIYGSDDKLIAVVGLDDIVIVDDSDALLVCRRGDAQRVKDIVSRLRAEGFEDHL